MTTQKTIIVCSSGGGHLEQLALLIPAFSNFNLVAVTPFPQQARKRGFVNVESIPDCNLRDPIKVIKSFIASWKIVKAVRPSIVLSTGAAPGLLCILSGKLLGSHVIWIDSIANSRKLSLSGRVAQYFCDDTFTQWEKLSSLPRVKYIGSVI